MTRIALFGGTFDPFHLGHLAMAESAVKALGLDQVRFLPCRISPHKQDAEPTAAAHRLRMMDLATADKDWAMVDDYEVHQEGPSYSWKTAEALRDHFPEARLFWIMGSDQWQALDRWDQPERLAASVEFIVFHRGEEPQCREGYKLHSLPAVHPANATEIRKQLVAGSKQHEWLDPKVATYISENQLYGSTS